MSYEQKIKKILKNNTEKVISEVISEAKNKNALKIYPAELDRWNYGAVGLDGKWVENEGPKADGSYDVMGLSSSDVCSYWNFYWWMPKNWRKFKESFLEYLEDINEFVVTGFFSRLKKDPAFLVKNIQTFVFVLNPFRVRRSGWIWVCDSKQSIIKSESWDLAEDIEAQKFGYKDSLDFFEKRNQTIVSLSYEEIKNLAESLEKKEPERVWEYFLSKHKYVQVSEFMWINELDFTCFVIDEKITPFDLRDGWSEKELTKPISIWIKTIYNLDIPVIFHRES
jgi:hypothetical protein